MEALCLTEFELLQTKKKLRIDRIPVRNLRF